jgi:uncharacterized protein YxeA
MKKLILWVVLCTVVLLGGCSGFMVSTTHIAKDNPYLDFQLKTVDYLSYDLTVTNKTNQDVEIIWDKTMYIEENNTTNDGFMFGDETFLEDRDRHRKPTIVFAKNSMKKTLYPACLAFFRRGWSHYYLPSGKSGVYIVVKVGDEEVKQRLYINISYKETKK